MFENARLKIRKCFELNWNLDCLKVLISLSVLIMGTRSDTVVYSDYGGLNLVQICFSKFVCDLELIFQMYLLYLWQSGGRVFVLYYLDWVLYCCCWGD